MSETRFVLNDVVAEVYTGNLEMDWCYIKITFIGLGMYINSFKVTASTEYEGYAVYPPRHIQKGRGLVKSVEFESKQNFGKVIEQLALRAAEIWREDDGDTKNAIVKMSDFNGLFNPVSII